MKISTIITDIEGTTSSIAFVHETLFPYSVNALPNFLKQNQDNPEINPLIKQVEQEANLSDASLEQIIEVLLNWIKQDKKITVLKDLQGYIWEEGFTNNQLKGHIYPDVVQELQKWHEQGLKLYIYSSGSIKAQKLLFGNSMVGDITPLFAGYFDTGVGSKKESTSYQNILNNLQKKADEVVFLSDVEAELAAAKEVGIKPILLVRESSTKPESLFPCAVNFQEVSTIIHNCN